MVVGSCELPAEPTTISRTSASLEGVGLKWSQSATHQYPVHKGRWEAKELDQFCGSSGYSPCGDNEQESDLTAYPDSRMSLRVLPLYSKACPPRLIPLLLVLASYHN